MAEKRKRMPKPMAISALMADVFRGHPLEKRLNEGNIWLVWDKAVGKEIAAKAQPAKFRDGVLTVAVSSAPWMQQLNFLKAGMMEKLNKRLGEELVKEIYLKAGRLERHHVPPRQHPAADRALTSEEQKRIGELTAAIEDPELREKFTSLMARHLAKAETED